MLNNPIIRREFVALMRSPRFHVMLAAVAFTTIALVMIRWPSDGLVDRSGDRAREVFTVFAFGLTAMITLLSPVTPATSIVVEKRSGTLALLLNSNLSPLSIYIGKLIGSLASVLFLLLVSTPAVTACFTMGGVSFGSHILPFYLVIAAASLQYATLGLLVSTLTMSTDSALRVTFGGVLGLSVLALAPNHFLQGMEGPLAALAIYLKVLSPLPAIIDIVGAGQVGNQGLVTEGAGVMTQFLIGATITSAVFAGATLRRLNWRLLDQARSQGIITDEQSLKVRAARRLFFLVDPQRRKTGIWWFMNPVMVKEFRCRQFGRFHWLMRIVAGCAVVSLGLACVTTMGSEEWGVETIGTIIVILQMALVLLFTPGIAAGLFSTERESGGWDLLRATPLSGGSILSGKLMSVLWTLLLILAATLPGYWVMIWIKPVLEDQIRQVIICLVLTSVFTILLSATVSSFFQRTAAATVTTYSILLTIYAGTILIWLGRDSPFGYMTVNSALTINTLAAALSIIDTEGFAEYTLVPMNWWVMGTVSGVLLCLLTARTYRLTRPA